MQIRDKLLFYLSSPVLALSLLLLFSLFWLLGLVSGVTSFYKNPQDYFRSWGFIGATAVLAVNLFFCTVRQLSRTLKARKAANCRLEDIATFPEKTGEEAKIKIINTLKRRGYRLQVLGSGDSIGFKNYFGMWSSVIFHTGMLIICLGVFIELGFSFTGRIALVPGQLFEDRAENYKFKQSGPFFSGNSGEFSLFLHNVEAKYKDTGVFAGGDISLIREGVEASRLTVEEGSPLGFKLWHIYFEDFGYFISAKLESGGEEYPLNIGLSTIIHKDSETYQADSTVDRIPYLFNIEFVPNISRYENGRIKSYKPDKPAVRLIITKTEKGRTGQVFNGIVAAGKNVSIDKGTKFYFEGFYPWVTFTAKKEPGLYVIYAGFAVSLLGLTLIFLWVPEWVRIRFSYDNGDMNIMIGGSTTRYKNEFQHRFDDLKKEIAGLLLKGD